MLSRFRSQLSGGPSLGRHLAQFLGMLPPPPFNEQKFAAA
jgi:hypothetical protein